MNFFSAKILLFGEYALLKGSAALAIPYPKLGSYWTDENPKSPTAKGSRFSLEKIWRHIHKNSNLRQYFDKQTWEKDEESGFWLSSNIPNGYGLGSSGSVCAAILKKYGKDIPENIQELQKILAEMENCWHGKSSGLDPLISYLNQAIYQNEKGELQNIDFHYQLQDTNVLLWDSHQKRNTTPLVKYFLEQAQSPHFQENALKPLITANANAINALLHNQENELWKVLEQISNIQYNYFQYMIPEKQKDLWKQGLDSKTFFLKLCGAGGGGYTLCFSKTKQQLPHTLEPYKNSFILLC